MGGFLGPKKIQNIFLTFLRKKSTVKKMKMTMKTLMCECNIRDFHEKGIEYIEHIEHFNCNCKNIHQYFVLTCKCHPFIEVVRTNDKFSSKVLGAYMICNFCVQLKHTINCCENKICIKKIPENIQKKLVPLNVFLKNELLPCEPF